MQSRWDMHKLSVDSVKKVRVLVLGQQVHPAKLY